MPVGGKVGGMRGRLFVGLGALLIAGAALYVLTIGKPTSSASRAGPPAMEEIDEKSRAAMREVLRDAK